MYKFTTAFTKGPNIYGSHRVWKPLGWAVAASSGSKYRIEIRHAS